MTEQPVSPARPNVLVITTDEERQRRWWPDGVSLPARERLAARGMSFTNHHVHSQPCSPSRGTMQTGTHTHTHGVFDNLNFDWQSSMPTTCATWGTLARAAGYATSYHGKWHLSTEEDLRDAEGRWSLDAYGYSDWSGPDVHGAPYSGRRRDPQVAEQAAAWISRHRHDTEPWLCVASFVNPHDIMLYPRFRTPRVPRRGAEPPATLHTEHVGEPTVHRRWRETCDVIAGRVRNDDTWRMIADAYVDLHVEVDRCISTVLDALSASGREQDTVVVLTSDHGDLAGAHGQRQKGAFIYREVTNVPLTIAWPGVTTPGSTTDSLTAAVDLAPTLAEVMGVPDTTRAAAGLVGTSLAPLVADPDTTVRERALFVYDAWTSLGLPTGDPPPGFLRGYTDGRHAYGRYFRPGEQHAPPDRCELELYDLVEDPDQTRNLAADRAGRRTLGDHEAVLGELIAAELGDDDPQVPAPVPDRRMKLLARLARRRPEGSSR